VKKIAGKKKKPSEEEIKVKKKAEKKEETSEEEFKAEIEEFLIIWWPNIKPPVPDDSKKKFIDILSRDMYNNQDQPEPLLLPEATAIRRNKIKRMLKKPSQHGEIFQSLDIELQLKVIGACAIQKGSKKTHDFNDCHERYRIGLQEVDDDLKGSRRDRWKWEAGILFMLFNSYNQIVGQPSIEGPFRYIAEWVVKKLTKKDLGERVYRRLLTQLKKYYPTSPALAANRLRARRLK
jgi:hypothetical protein